MFSISVSLSAIKVLFLKFAQEELIESRALSFEVTSQLLQFGNGEIGGRQELSPIVDAIAELREGPSSQLIALLSIPDALSYWLAGEAEQVEIFKRELLDLSAFRGESVVESTAPLASDTDARERYLYIAVRECIITSFMKMFGSLRDSIELVVPQHLTHISCFGCTGLLSKPGTRIFLGGEHSEGVYSLWRDGMLLSRGAFGEQGQHITSCQSDDSDWIENFFEEMRSKTNSTINEVYIAGSVVGMSTIHRCLPGKAVTIPRWYMQEVRGHDAMAGIHRDIETGSFDDCLGLISLYDEQIVSGLYGRSAIGD